jgi:hypothetical protein
MGTELGPAVQGSYDLAATVFHWKLMRDRVLTYIERHPFCVSRELRRAFPDVRPRALFSCLERLRDESLIDFEDGHYLLSAPDVQPEALPVVVRRHSPSTFISPPSRERLMAGR